MFIFDRFFSRPQLDLEKGKRMVQERKGQGKGGGRKKDSSAGTRVWNCLPTNLSLVIQPFPVDKHILFGQWHESAA